MKYIRPYGQNEVNNYSWGHCNITPISSSLTPPHMNILPLPKVLAMLYANWITVPGDDYDYETDDYECWGMDWWLWHWIVKMTVITEDWRLWYWRVKTTTIYEVWRIWHRILKMTKHSRLATMLLKTKDDCNSKKGVDRGFKCAQTLSSYYCSIESIPFLTTRAITKLLSISETLIHTNMQQATSLFFVK